MSEVYLKMDNLSSQIETQKSKLKLISSKLKETTS
jgi:hypothetical protein